MSNLSKRILTAIILAPLVLLLIIKGGSFFFFAAMALYMGMIYEWINLTAKVKKHRLTWIVSGFLYITLACCTLVIFELYGHQRTSYPKELIYIILIVWFSDIFAFIFGRTIGGPKLAPKISPNKTWAGVFGGITGTVILFLVVNYYMPFSKENLFILTAFSNFMPVNNTDYAILAFSVFLCIVSIIGDLLESYIKRRLGVKDSGNIIPGHGGLLDRLDSLLLVMNFFGIIILYATLTNMDTISSAIEGMPK